MMLDFPELFLPKSNVTGLKSTLFSLQMDLKLLKMYLSGIIIKDALLYYQRNGLISMKHDYPVI